MADPVSLAVMTGVSIASTAAGGIVTARAQQQGGVLERQMYDYRKKIAEQNAAYEIARGERQAGERGFQQAQERGNIIAGLSGRGLDVTRGSAERVIASQGDIAKIEQQDIRDAAARRSFAERTQADLYGAAGQTAEWAGRARMYGTLLGTGAQVSSRWLQASSMGAFGGGGMGGIDTGVGLSPFGGSNIFG